MSSSSAKADVLNLFPLLWNLETLPENHNIPYLHNSIFSIFEN